jgi:transposase
MQGYMMIDKQAEQEIKALRKENQELKEVIFALKRSIRAIEATNKTLVEENHQLKERLGLNSSNSSLSPSRDLYKQKKENRPISPSNPGGQPGHQAHQYQLMEADQVINLAPTKCKCGHEILIGDHYTREQKIEIPPIKPYVKEYRRWHGRCSKCGRKAIAPLSGGVNKDLLGPHAKAIIGSLNGHFHNSRRELQEILEEIFHLPISQGLVNNTARRVKEKLTKSYQEIEEKVKTSTYLHIDETGHRCQGKRGWAWMFTNQEASLVKLSPSRGKHVLVDSLGAY